MGHWTDWLNDRTILMVLAVVAWLGQRVLRLFKQAKGARDSSQPARTASGKRFDPQQEERTRRVQAEVARKIAQRKAAAQRMPVPPPPPPVARPDPFRPPEPRDVPRPPEPQEVPRPPEQEASLRPTEPSFTPPTLRLENLPRRPAITVAASRPVATPVALTALRQPGILRVSPWATELKDRAAARRAIVLREILGPPVGLREMT